MNIIESIVNNAINSLPRNNSATFVEAETARVFSQLSDLNELIRMDKIEPISLVENESINDTFDKFFNKIHWYLYMLSSDYLIVDNKLADISTGLHMTTDYTESALASTYAFIKAEVDKITLLGKDYISADYYNFSTKPNWKFNGILADKKSRKLILQPASSNSVQSTLDGIDAESYSTNPLTMIPKADGTAFATYAVSGPFNTLTIQCNASAGVGTLLTSIVAVKNGNSTVIGPIKPIEMYSSYDTKVFLPYTDADYVIFQFEQKYTTSSLDGNQLIKHIPIIINYIDFNLTSYTSNGSATFTVSDTSKLHSLYIRRYSGIGNVSFTVNTGSSSNLYIVSDSSNADVSSTSSFTVTVNLSTTDEYQTPVVRDLAVVRR